MIVERQLVVLDDDPTGAQAMSGVPMLFEWESGELQAAARSGSAAIHLLTNTRAYSAERAYAVTHSGAIAATQAFDNPRILLRGDSTLRGHVKEEYLAVCDAAYRGQRPVLLLVPALPPAGRITIGGVHLLAREGRRTPLHETEYARDPSFGYQNARLLQWAEDRTDGLLPRPAGEEIPLDEIRTRGRDAVAESLIRLSASGQAAGCAPDAESIDDLVTIANGLRDAEAGGASVVVRSAPTFAGVLAGNLATEHVAMLEPVERLLVICGSFVPLSTRQLAELVAANPSTAVEADIAVLASPQAASEVERLGRRADELLAKYGLAIISTPRERVDVGLAAGERIAVNLARVLGQLQSLPDAVLAKGGVTSAVTAREGLGAAAAWVMGPLVDGVSLWKVDLPSGGQIPYVVFPGNVGGDDTLAEVVEKIRGI